MIPVHEQPPPARFDDDVSIPGGRILDEMCGLPVRHKRRSGRACVQREYGPREDRRLVTTYAELPASNLRDFAYWTAIIPELMSAYGSICAYTGFRVEHALGSPTVDHFVPLERDVTKAYDWSNYRLSCRTVNSHKGTKLNIIDPFTVQKDWFRVNLFTFHIIPGPFLSTTLQKRIREEAIEPLKLNEDQKLVGLRRRLYMRFTQNNDYASLCEDAPIVAHTLWQTQELSDPRDIALARATFS